MFVETFENHSASLLLVNSESLHHVRCTSLCNVCMRTIGEIRRLRLQKLLIDKELTMAALGRKLGRSSRDSTLGQIANASPDSKTGKPRQMGDEQARAIEQAMELPHGWMDRDPDMDALESLLGELRREVAAAHEPPARYSNWPFRLLDLNRVLALSPAALAQLEAQMLQAVQMAEALAAPPTKRQALN